MLEHHFLTRTLSAFRGIQLDRDEFRSWPSRRAMKVIENLLLPLRAVQKVSNSKRASRLELSIFLF